MAIAAAGVAIVGGVTQAVVSAKRANKISDAIKNYERQDLTNAYENTRVSTLSAELQQEELARATASSVQALRAGGVRAVGAGSGSVQAANINAARTIGADLDMQQKRIEDLRATDEVRIQQATEVREQADLTGMGNELNTQRQNTTNGINTAVSGVGSAFSAIGAMGGVGSKIPKVSAVKTTTQGLTTAKPQAPIYTG